MDTILLIAILIGVLGAGALLAALFVATRRNSGGRESAELAARLAQMTEAQAAQQAQLALTLQAQERTLAKTVDERLQLQPLIHGLGERAFLGLQGQGQLGLLGGLGFGHLGKAGGQFSRFTAAGVAAGGHEKCGQKRACAQHADQNGDEKNGIHADILAAVTDSVSA